jgi:hypothetical protein
MVPLGAEVRILPSLVARAGACINHPADIVHFGVGICLQNIRFDFDYGISHAVSDVEAKWLFGLSYSLKKKKGEAPAHNGREGSAAAAPPKVSVSPKDTMAVTPIVPPDSARSSQPPAPTSAVPLDSLPLPAGSEPASPAIPPSNVFPEHSAPKADFPELPVDSISQ